ncbi:P-loop containing nucleoside triphosphate hydrolases superfamily protein [Raphanus sativus]|uniref:Kinesin-like protein KIN-14T n=1 Tax=Raphanus sativus TaxID=3726 RepID=A0A9W3C9S4_RAPSA|nr:kinesin-like protein KIN-14T [Raphanus sativus]KAJ4881983.1 P-loop containing nucleoside triphosphate hydrolases superfamily protein [Raphanus sativus]
MERTTSSPVQNLPETIHSLLGLKSHMTSYWVKSVCNISKNVSSFSEISSTSKEEDNSAFIEEQSIRDQLSALTVQVNDQNKRRRQILNEFLDLKGNIRVFCRVKPLDSKKSRAPVSSDARNIIIKLTESKRKTYNFDRVFQPDSSQDDVFLEIEPVIKSVIDGYNACIFAYGQTGTGKTFTMEGLPESPGIVPRAIKGLFKQVEQSNHKFVIKFSMLEIYMGNLRDLLVSQGTKPIGPIPPSLLIHTDPKGDIDIENLVTLKVNDFDEVFKLYKIGCRSRATAFTNSNSASSRSHCMIRVSITCAGAAERRRGRNKIWLVDLGGSERVLKTKATGRRFDEGKAINLSLSALGDVINSLQRKNAHIPYRNSKLTQVLKDSLGQDSKTLMLVHISRKEDDLCETICSLNFATRAKNIHLGQDESKEEQEKKEIVMMNLQKMMETIEKDRETTIKDIRHLNETLEKLSGKPHVTEEAEEVDEIIREEIQVTPKLKRNKSRRASDVYSSFMRPTASSNRRLSSGADFSAISNGPGLKSRRNSMTHVRSESVCLPMMKNGYDSLCDSSERSVSKSNCAMRKNREDDAATVYSQDISECDIKLVVSEHKKQVQQTGPGSEIGVFEKTVSQKEGETEFSRINSWLHSQSENGSYLLDKKQRLNRNISLERSSNGNETLEDIEESKTEETVIKHPLLLNDLFELECLCSAETEDQVLCKYPNPNEEDNTSLHLPSFRYDGLCEHIDDAWFGVDGSAARKQDSPVSGLLLELNKTLPYCQRELAFEEDVAPPFLRPQGILVERGRCAHALMQKLEGLCFRTLVGLGLIDVSYGSDFFNGLMQ